MNESLNRRLTFVGSILLILAMLVAYRLVSIQFIANTSHWQEEQQREYLYKVTLHPPRGEIYDRNRVLMATNALEYEIGLSPVLIYDRQETAEKLSAVIGIPVDELMADMSSPSLYIQLVHRATATMGKAVIALDLDGVSVSPVNLRFYPHGSLASHVLGFVSGDEVGYYGVEGYYNQDLSGKLTVSSESRIPFEVTGGAGMQRGSNLYLTLDSEIQYLCESVLAQAINDYGATSGTIIVMDPHSGDILAMANAPTFDPNQYGRVTDANLFTNPAISDQFEPGSTVKVMTMGIALDAGTVQADSTYDDTGEIEVGGVPIQNWDHAAHGVTSMTDLLAHSLNVGAAKLSLAVGPTKFYHGLDLFGMGKLTGIDLEGEANGQFRKPGETNWHEADLAENSFGQALATTPLQLLIAIGSMANDGLMMEPHIVSKEVKPDGTITSYGPTVLGRTVSQQTARTVSAMLADGLRRETKLALVPGYSVAGKTGTAQIPIPGGYDPEKTIASFIGWGPLDTPRFVVLVKLDKPSTSPYGSETAAPTFSKLVQRLVVLMEIPPDDVRAQVAGGG